VSHRTPAVDADRLTQTLLDLVRIDSPSTKETEAIDYVRRVLVELGTQPSEDAIGNVYAHIPGVGPAQRPILLNAHLDTVQPTPGIQVRIKDGIVRTDGKTILGADDKAGVAAILEVLRLLRSSQAPHPPLDVLFTVQEEIGLFGAKAVDYARLGATEGLCLDSSGPPHHLTVAAPGQNDVRANFVGQSAHAGVAPELGKNAILAAARAISAMPLGRIDAETTANVGTIDGGQARNIVPDRCAIVGEARSRNAQKLAVQTEAMVRAMKTAAEATGCRAEVEVKESYTAFSHDETTPIVRRCVEGIRALGKEPSLVATGGGSDANIFNRHGIATVLLGIGYEDIHTTSEHIALSTLADVARTLLAIVTAAG